MAGVPRMLGTYSVRDYIPFTRCVPRYTPHRTFLGTPTTGYAWPKFLGIIPACDFG